MPDFPWVKPDDFIHRFGPDIVAIDYRAPIGRWVELGRMDIVYKVSNNETLIFRRRGVHRMPSIDDEVDQIHQPPPPAHFFKGISGQRTAVRMEKKAREQSGLVMGSRRGSPFNPLASSLHPSALTTPARNDDGGSSDVEVSEITDCRDLMRRASNRPHTDVVPYKHTQPSNGGSSNIEVVVETNGGFTRQVHNSDPSHTHALLHSSSSSPSPIIADSQASSPPSSADSDPETSSRLAFAESSCPTSPEQSNYHTDSSPPSSLSALPLQLSSSFPLKSRPKKDLPWHHGLYCVDVVDGFEKMGSTSLKGLSKSERFDIAFPGRRYADSTVRDAQKQWALASNSAKEAAIAAGRTTGGLWRVFSAQHPIKHRKSMGRPN